jgi:RimJ/RimL family protein N-acetyltransferase
MIHLNNETHGNLTGKKSGVIYRHGHDSVISREENGELYGGVVYQNYTKHSIFMHFAGFRPNWANRELIHAAFAYPFVHLGCVKVFGAIPETNKVSTEIAEKLGFVPVALIPDVFAGGGLRILAMARHDCRWLPPQEVVSGSIQG